MFVRTDSIFVIGVGYHNSPEANWLAAEVRPLLEVTHGTHGVLEVRVHLHLERHNEGRLSHSTARPARLRVFYLLGELVGADLHVGGGDRSHVGTHVVERDASGADGVLVFVGVDACKRFIPSIQVSHRTIYIQ